MPGESVNVFEIQRMADETRDVNKLKALRELIQDSDGTGDQKQILLMFINGKIRQPDRPSLTSKGRSCNA